MSLELPSALCPLQLQSWATHGLPLGVPTACSSSSFQLAVKASLQWLTPGARYGWNPFWLQRPAWCDEHPGHPADHPTSATAVSPGAACPQDISCSEPLPTVAPTALPRKPQCGSPLELPMACTYHNYSSAEPAKVAPVQLYPMTANDPASSSYSHCGPTMAVAAVLHSLLQLQPACLGSPGAVFLQPMPTSVPAHLPKASSTHSPRKGSSYTRPLLQDQERLLFC